MHSRSSRCTIAKEKEKHKDKEKNKRKRERGREREEKKGKEKERERERESGGESIAQRRAQLSVECVGLIAQFHVRRLALHMENEAILQCDCCMLEMGCLDVSLACVSVGLRTSAVE